jgi:hypothetical protein
MAIKPKILFIQLLKDKDVVKTLSIIRKQNPDILDACYKAAQLIILQCLGVEYSEALQIYNDQDAEAFTKIVNEKLNKTNLEHLKNLYEKQKKEKPQNGETLLNLNIATITFEKLLEYAIEIKKARINLTEYKKIKHEAFIIEVTHIIFWTAGLLLLLAYPPVILLQPSATFLLISLVAGVNGVLLFDHILTTSTILKDLWRIYSQSLNENDQIIAKQAIVALERFQRELNGIRALLPKVEIKGEGSTSVSASRKF